MSARKLLLVVLPFLLPSCDQTESPLVPEVTDPGLLLSVVDGSAPDGLPGFYFRPPIVPGTPAGTGEFDASLLDLLAVEICEWTGDGCALPLIRRITSEVRPPEGLKVNESAGFYRALWTTKGDDLDPEKTYRVRVLASGGELGHADVDVVEEDEGGWNPQGAEMVRLAQGDGLPIVFRIEEGLGERAGAEDRTVTLAGRAVTLDLPEGALSGDVFFTATPADVPPGGPPIAPGTAWDLGPDGLDFGVPVWLTLSYDPANLPPGTEEDELRIHKLVDGKFIKMDAGSVDEVEHTVTALVDGFSVYVASESSHDVRVCGAVGGDFPNYATLAAGVAAVAEDGVVHLCAGVHEANSLVLDKAVTIEPESDADVTVHGSLLMGHETGTVTIRGITLVQGESAGAVSGSGTYADVLLEELTFLESSASFEATTVSDAHVVVRNVDFLGGGRAGLSAYSAPWMEVLDSYFEAQTGLSSLQFQGGQDGLILRNRFEECGWRGCIRVVNAGTVLIAENTIRTTARAEVFEERFGSGVIAGLVADGVDVTAERNVVVGVGPVSDPNDQSTYPMSQFGALTAWYGAGSTTFRDNEVRNAGVGIGGWALSLTATGNVVEDVHTALYLQGALLPSVDIRENDFTGYVVSIEVYGDPVAPGSMTCNWWGDENGPQNPIGAGAGVYTPFATEPIAGTGRGC